MIPSNQIDSIVNHNHKEEHDNTDEQSSNNNINGLDLNNELLEAQKQIALLREHLNETNGNLKEDWKSSVKSVRERFRQSDFFRQRSDIYMRIFKLS
jgi:hypothetical protein